MTKCKCSKELNNENVVSIQKLFDMVLKEYRCDSCNAKFITRNGKFLREGSIKPLVEIF